MNLADFHDNEQNRFISRVRGALGYSQSNQRNRKDLVFGEKFDKAGEYLEKVKIRTDGERRELLNTLIEAGKPINLHVISKEDSESVATAIADLVQRKNPEWGNQKSVVAWKHPLIEGLNLAKALEEQNIPVYYTELGSIRSNEKSVTQRRNQIRNQIIESYVGVTSADFCMADTATLVIKTRPGQARSVSLIPSIHIAVIEMKKIIANLKELYILLKYDSEEKEEGLTNCMTFISGPSKTADIEGVMVQGAHGPREVYLYVITG